MKRLLLSAVVAALFASPAYGQTLEGAYQRLVDEAERRSGIYDGDSIIVDNAPDVTKYTEIIVTGSRLNYVDASVFTAPASIIGSHEIQARGNSYVSDILRTVPGVSVSRSGPAGSLTQLRLRGSEGNHVLVLVDGIEVSNPNTGEFDFGSLRSEDVVRIEVLRGEQSALWGSDAIGGVVNIITRAGALNSNYEGYKISVEAGSFGTLEGQVSAVIPIGFTALSINGNAFTSDGYDVSGLDDEEDGAKSRSINIGLNNVELGGVTFLGKYSGSHAVSEFDSDTDFNGRLDNTNAELETNTKTGRVSARFNLGGFDHLVNFSLSDTKQFTTGTSFRNDTAGKRTQANWAAEKIWANHKLSALAETEKESFSNFGGVGGFQNQKENIQNHALAADYRYNKKAVTLTASARQDFNDRFDDSLTWRVGAGYAFEDFSGRIRGSVGSGVKNPSMTELFGFFPGSFVSNPNLIPEKSMGYSIGYDQDIGEWKFSADYFHSDLEDEILTIFNPNFTSTVINSTNDSKREGVELEARGSFGDTFDVRASATFLDAKENGVREVRRPDFLASATATWTPTEQLSFTLSADHTGSQIDTDFATFSRVELPAFTLVGLNAQWSPTEVVTLSVRGDNLLNEDYQEVVGFKSQGRGVYAGFSVNF